MTVAFAAFNVNVNPCNESKLSDLSLANVEALANGEAIVGITCEYTLNNWCFATYEEGNDYIDVYLGKFVEYIVVEY